MATRGDELRAYLFAKRLDELGSCLRRTSYRDLDAAGAVAFEPGVGGVVAEVQCDLVRDDTIPTGFFPTGSLKLTPASARSSIRDQAGERNSQDRSTGLDHSSSSGFVSRSTSFPSGPIVRRFQGLGDRLRRFIVPARPRHARSGSA